MTDLIYKSDKPIYFHQTLVETQAFLPMTDEIDSEATRRSKRNRTASFDISRNYFQSVPKHRKKANSGKMVNPPSTGDQSIIDMSQSINSNPQPNNGVSNRNPTDPQQINNNVNGNPDENMLRQMANENVANVQLNLRPLIQECVGGELKKVYEAIGKLGDMVKNITDTASATNQTIFQPSNIHRDFTAPPPLFLNNRPPEIPSSNMMLFPPGPNLERPSKVEKFKLKFDGNPSGISVEDFVFRLEYLKNQYKVSWEEIFAEFQSPSSGAEYEW